MPGASEPGVVWAKVFEFVIEERSADLVEMVSDLLAGQPGEFSWSSVLQLCYGVGSVFCSDACVRVVVPGVEFALESVLN